jgi:hypothetical protein
MGFFRIEMHKNILGIEEKVRFLFVLVVVSVYYNLRCSGIVYLLEMICVLWMYSFVCCIL